jgi:NAD(P)-dependent dehydrogenase (short-subunit alcohol dehydrogenase family)
MRFQNRVVVVVGASGGLGAAAARAFAAEGARVALTYWGRDVSALANETGGKTFRADVTDAQSVAALRDTIWKTYGRADILINATGYDVRKSLISHSEEDIARSLDVNLRGAILLTQAFAAPMAAQSDGGLIVHLGGFADGRLAFPYYTVDAATRAGVYTFVEAVNRELRGSGVTVSYFSPSPADTPAERPYHALWRKLGQPIVTPEQVARELLNATAAKRKVYVMGGWITRLFAAINAVAPDIADLLALRHYGKVMKGYLT